MAFPHLKYFSGKNKCMCSISHALGYGCVWLCAIHNSSALNGGASFVLVALTTLNVSKSEHWGGTYWGGKIQYFSVSA